MVVSASTNQVWTKITIRSYAHVFCHSESDRSSVRIQSGKIFNPLWFSRLDVHANNATSELYKARKELKINFYSASNFDEILVNTPLGSISFESKKVYFTVAIR